MCNYDWTGLHDYLRTRAQAQAVFEQRGFQFTGEPLPKKRPQHPRLIGTTPDHYAHLELIGPDEVIFKATLLVPHAAQNEPLRARTQAALLDFVATWLPGWFDGTSWVTAHYPLLGEYQPGETRFRELVISLQSAYQGAKVALNVSWQPVGNRPALAQ